MEVVSWCLKNVSPEVSRTEGRHKSIWKWMPSVDQERWKGGEMDRWMDGWVEIKRYIHACVNKHRNTKNVLRL